MTVPESLPLESHLAVDDFQTSARKVKRKLLAKLTKIRKLEETDFTDDEAAFRRHAAMQAEATMLIDFIKVAELTIETLCDNLGYRGLRLHHYRKLWIANEALQTHNQILEQTNDVLTDLLLNHYDHAQQPR